MRRSWDNSRRIALRRVHEYLCGKARSSVQMSQCEYQQPFVPNYTDRSESKSATAAQTGPHELSNRRSKIPRIFASSEPCRDPQRSIPVRFWYAPAAYISRAVGAIPARKIASKEMSPATCSSHQIASSYVQTSLFQSGLQDLAQCTSRRASMCTNAPFL